MKVTVDGGVAGGLGRTGGEKTWQLLYLDWTDGCGN
jgi:hypothetical protein